MKQLLILSGKGGTGKTTIASAFIKLSKAKVYADCDVDAPNLHLILNQTSNPKVSDYYALEKAYINADLCIECGLCKKNCRFDAIIKENNKFKVDQYACEGCGVCQALCPNNAVVLKPVKAGDLKLYKNGEVFSTAQLKMGNGTSGMLVSEVKKQMINAAKNADFAIIDGSPGIGCPVIASISGVDMILIVAEPSISGISDMERIKKTADNFKTKTAVCINKFDTNLENTRKIQDYCKTNNLPFTGTIPFDYDAVKAINKGVSIVEIDCISADAIKKVYDKTIKLLLSES